MTTRPDLETTNSAGPGGEPTWVVAPRGSMARFVRTRPVRDLDVVLEGDGASTYLQAKTGTAPTTTQAEFSWQELADLIRRYAVSRAPDEAAADRLTGHVMKTARRSLWRGASDREELSAKVIGLAMRTANSWEEAARRAHATPPPLPTAMPHCRSTPAVAVRYPDPQASRAVFVGADSTPAAPRLPEAERSATALARLAGTVARPTVLSGEQATREQTLRTIANAAAEATDLLLVYYAGHGQLSDGEHFTVGTADSTFPFNDLYQQAQRTRATHVVFILDACASGAAARDVGPLDTAPRDRDEYMITATSPYEAALARDPASKHGYTAFTGALVDVLAGGVPGGGDDLDIATLYSAVDQALARDTLPRPHLYAAGRTREPWALAPNPCGRAAAGRKARHRNLAPADEQLLAASTDGDQRSWSELVDRYGRLVWSTARSFRLDERECGKVFRDTWLLLLCDADDVHAANLPRYLTETTRRRSIEALRERAETTAPNSCSMCAAHIQKGPVRSAGQKQTRSNKAW